MILTRLKTFLGFIVCFLLWVSVAQSQDSECLIQVKLVGGSKDVPRGSFTSVNEFLGDMEEQLRPLPYKSFEILDSKLKQSSLGVPVSFVLKGNSLKEVHKIGVTLHEVKKRRVGLTVNWVNPKGEELLATRLKVVNNKNLVLGTDSAVSVPTILSIKVDCPN